MSSADLCGQRVLGVNGSLKNWINTGSADVVVTSKNNQAKQKEPKNNNFSSVLKGAIIALGAVSAGALLFNGKKVDFSKFKKYLSDAFSSFKTSKPAKALDKAVEDVGIEAQKVKKSIKKFEFPKFEFKKPEFKSRKKSANEKQALNVKQWFSNTFKLNMPKKAARVKTNQSENVTSKNKKTIKSFFAGFFAKFKKTKPQIETNNPKALYKGNPKVRKNTLTQFQRNQQKLENAVVEEVVEDTTSKTLYKGNPNARKNTVSKYQKLADNSPAAQDVIEEVIEDTAPKALYKGNPKVRKNTLTKAQKQQQELQKFDIEDIIAEFSDKPQQQPKYSGSVAARKNAVSKYQKLADNSPTAQDAIDEVIEDTAPKALYKGDSNVRKNTLTKAQKQQQELEKFDIEDIIAEFSDKPQQQPKYSGSVAARKSTLSKVQKQQLELEKNRIKIGDEIEIPRRDNSSLFLKYGIDEAGNSIFQEVSEQPKSKPVYSEKQMQKMEAQRLKKIEQLQKHLNEAMNYSQEEIQAKLQKIKDFGYSYYTLDGKNGFNRDFVVSKKMIDELEQVGFPFNVKPNDILEALEIDDLNEGECCRILFNPNPRFRLGEYKLNSKGLQTLVGITKKQDGTLSFIYV
ncbi:MAG: hypothetical protein E7Z88_02130 [Cyanobacteria bacterium SIG27]|nr:hypothetical protein [Cyanobacteria bacterium SIG27]